eukprot:4118581-Prymnesium_polylepis.1
MHKPTQIVPLSYTRGALSIHKPSLHSVNCNSSTQLAARSLSCCICTARHSPHRRAFLACPCIRPQYSRCRSVIVHGALTALRGHPLLGPRTPGCGYNLQKKTTVLQHKSCINAQNQARTRLR